jgi:hypothetical protein
MNIIIPLLIILIIILIYIYINNRQVSNKQKYIIYKSSGGLTHYLKGLIKAYIIAIEQNRILVIDNDQESMNKLKFNDFFKFKQNINYIDNDYSLLPDDIIYKNKYNKTDIVNSKCVYKDYNKYYIYEYNSNLSIFNNHENLVIYCGPGINTTSEILKYISINNTIMDKLNKSNKINNNYISIHYRNTDIKNNIDKYIDKVNQYNKNINTLYLASDDYNAYETFKRILPNMNVIRYVIPNNNKGNNIHSNVITYEEAYKQMYETLLDMYMIFNSTYFIPSNNSGLSQFIKNNIQSEINIFNNMKSNCIVIDT